MLTSFSNKSFKIVDTSTSNSYTSGVSDLKDVTSQIESFPIKNTFNSFKLKKKSNKTLKAYNSVATETNLNNSFLNRRKKIHNFLTSDSLLSQSADQTADFLNYVRLFQPPKKKTAEEIKKKNLLSQAQSRG